MITIGIDPGCSGALVALLDGQTLIAGICMPVVKSGKSTRVNGAAVAAFLRAYPPAHVYLERVGSMPGEGIGGGFSFGHSAGVVEGVVQALALPYTLVTPQTWKRRLGLLGTDKEASRARAIQLWPDFRGLDTKGKGQAFADAALVAYAGDPGRLTT